ncbi:hypothetical protein [Pseudooceanicola sediminis]|uniref:hypothetical protein n=1 Tax=Pseudooceanicola sediminis TaxID=2211117 RepID=UPI001F1A8983|nr:hypothetical protein [Pseudooceanicola sediminis]
MAPVSSLAQVLAQVLASPLACSGGRAGTGWRCCNNGGRRDSPAGQLPLDFPGQTQ